MSNNPKLDLVSMNPYIKFGENMSICFQDSELKSMAITLVQIWEK